MRQVTEIDPPRRRSVYRRHRVDRRPLGNWPQTAGSVAMTASGAPAFRRDCDLRRVPDLDGQLLAQRPERGFDLIESGVVCQIEEPVHIDLGDSHAAHHFRFAHAGGFERRVQFSLGGVQRG